MINQHKAAMKVGTDGVLLGAWARVKGAKRILDAGTGTGLIALMLAQRCDAWIDAVDIDKDACEQAMDNVMQSPWPERIHVMHTSFEEFVDKTENNYDLIVSNPPYFTRSLKSPDHSRSLARQGVSLSVEKLCLLSKKCLTANGKLAMIVPTQYFEKTVSEGFFLSRKCCVKPQPMVQCKRMLVELSMEPSNTIEEELVIEKRERHKYSKEYIALTKDYYLKM
jgi:tRNA1Val (adenine37-N6)-methyltransferase